MLVAPPAPGWFGVVQVTSKVFVDAGQVPLTPVKLSWTESVTCTVPGVVQVYEADTPAAVAVPSEKLQLEAALAPSVVVVVASNSAIELPTLTSAGFTVYQAIPAH